ncbi:MAG: gamma-glutamylcyclotransferase family protein [Pseudomonadota bacterium]
MIYLAYGSNLLFERLRARCPSAKKHSIATLPDYRLAFTKPSIDGSGKATVLPALGQVVQGVLFHIDAPDRSALDRAEGPGYRVARVNATLPNGDADEAFTYVARETSELPVYDWYLALIRAGYDQNGLNPGPELNFPTVPDLEPTRPGRVAAFDALRAAGRSQDITALEATIQS